MTTYKEALDWIHSRLKFGVKLGLSRMEWLMEQLGHPERGLKVIHVGGTNGKGSTVTFMRSILNEAGYQVGTFTSPYIEQFNERISMNGEPIADEEIVALVERIRPLAEELEKSDLGSPTEFEIITAMALYYFSQTNKVDIVIIEVGMGGRYDSTNVVNPILSIITNIGMDHTNILGETIEKIAYEKAGILKYQVATFTAVSEEQSLAVLQAEAKKKNAPLFQLGKDFFVTHYKPSRDGETFTFTSPSLSLKDVHLSMLGEHQTKNATLAIASLNYLNNEQHVSITEQAIKAGVKAAYWPGRLEQLHNEPMIIIDGAHNPEGLKALERTIRRRYEGKNTHIVFAALKDKDLSEMFSILKRMQANVYFTEFDFPRAAKANELKRMSNMIDARVGENWKSLIKKLVHEIDTSDLLIIVGSLYFISQVKPFLQKVIKKV